MLMLRPTVVEFLDLFLLRSLTPTLRRLRDDLGFDRLYSRVPARGREAARMIGAKTGKQRFIL